MRVSLWLGLVYLLHRIAIKLWVVSVFLKSLLFENHGASVFLHPVTWVDIQLQIAILLYLEETRRVHVAHRMIFGDRFRQRKSGGDAMSMVSDSIPIAKRILLVGGGHAHVSVLKDWKMNRIPGVKTTLVSRQALTPYSGMVPGFVSGKYSLEECHVDLSRLCRYAQVEFIMDEVCAADLVERKIMFTGQRPPLSFDVVSFDIGSSPAFVNSQQFPSSITPVKPIDQFTSKWDRFMKELKEHSWNEAIKVAVVGTGAGGVEILLSIQARLEREFPESIGKIQYFLIGRDKSILKTHNIGVQTQFLEILKRRKIQLLLNTSILNAESNGIGTDLHLSSSEILFVHACFWCTGGITQSWLGETGLDLSQDGSIKVNNSLQSTSHDFVFAAGDCAYMVRNPRPKAGVFAVRQGPPLTLNLRKFVLGERLRTYRPQNEFLSLVSTGVDNECVASRGHMVFNKEWISDLKDWIDRGFMNQYSFDLEIPQVEIHDAISRSFGRLGDSAGDLLSRSSMRCGGCGSKISGNTLSEVLAQLSSKIVSNPSVVAGLASGDDAAFVSPPPEGYLLLQSVDFFRSFLSDDYYFGQIAVNHALNDCYAKGATPQTALALVVVPFASESLVAESMLHLLSGACDALAAADCALVGGHSAEGKDLSLGFFISGVVRAGQEIRKGGFHPGDVLIVTKPLGTGTIFSSHMKLKCPGMTLLNAMESASLSNRKACEILTDFHVSACTDISGFGLVRHLEEMLNASSRDTCAILDLQRIPLIPGAEDCLLHGSLSSLHVSNKGLDYSHAKIAPEDYAQFEVLFDPQTSGPLMFSVPMSELQACISSLIRQGYKDARAIGIIETRSDLSSSRIRFDQIALE